MPSVKKASKKNLFSVATIKRYTSVHTWTGITTGILLFVAFYAGSWSLFKHEIDSWANPKYLQDHAQIASGRGHTAQEVLDAYWQQDLAQPKFTLIMREGRHPFVTFRAVVESDAEINKGTQHGASSDPSNEPSQEPSQEPKPISLVQYRPDSPVEEYIVDSNSVVARFIETIHFSMGLPRGLGRQLFGIVTLIYGVALFSGLLIHLPQLIKDLFVIRRGKNKKLRWKDAHNVIGVVSFPFHLMFVITSLILCISLQSALLTGVVTMPNGIDQKQAQSFIINMGVEQTTSDVPADMIALDTLIASLRETVPGAQPFSMLFDEYGSEAGRVRVYFNYPNELTQRGSVSFSTVTGEELAVDRPGEHNPIVAARSIFRTLHYGELGEGETRYLSKAAYVVLGMLGAFLFYSGNLLWLETRRKRRQTVQPRHVRVIARLTLAGCLGTVLGISLMLLVAKCLPVDYAQRAVLEPLIWYIGLGVSLLWTMIRPIWRSGYELLYACAFVTALLPVANGILYLPLWQTISFDTDVFLIDVLAIILAIGFYRLAKSSQMKAHNRTDYSVWSPASQT